MNFVDVEGRGLGLFHILCKCLPRRLRKIKKNFSQYSPCPGSDSCRTPSKYYTEALPPDSMYSAMSTVWQASTFRRYLLTPSSGYKTLVPVYWSTWYHIPKSIFFSDHTVPHLDVFWPQKVYLWQASVPSAEDWPELVMGFCDILEYVCQQENTVFRGDFTPALL